MKVDYRIVVARGSGWRGGGEGKWEVGIAIKGNMRNTCHDGNVLNFYSIHDNIQAVTLFNRLTRCHHLEGIG